MRRWQDEIYSAVFENFQRKVVGHYGWIDAYFQGLNNSYVESKEDELGFGIRDENGDSYSKCRAIKRDPHNGSPDPVISEIMNLKRGDKVRFIGVGMPDVQNDNMNKLTGFYVSKIEIIETATEKMSQRAARHKRIHEPAAEQKTPRYVTCRSQHCDGHIEFDCE